MKEFTKSFDKVNCGGQGTRIAASLAPAPLAMTALDSTRKTQNGSSRHFPEPVTYYLKMNIDNLGIPMRENLTASGFGLLINSKHYRSKWLLVQRAQKTFTFRWV